MAFALVFGLLWLSFPSMADERQDRGQWMNEIRQYRRTYMSKELGLSREQQNKFFPLYEEMEAQTSQIDEDLRVMESRLYSAPDATDLEYEKAAEAMYDGKVRQAEIEKSYMAKFHDVLSRKQLFELKKVERSFQRDLLKQHQRLRSQRMQSQREE